MKSSMFGELNDFSTKLNYHESRTLNVAQHMMMETPKFNEYEQREAKNFILLESRKDEFSSSN